MAVNYPEGMKSSNDVFNLTQYLFNPFGLGQQTQTPQSPEQSQEEEEEPLEFEEEEETPPPQPQQQPPQWNLPPVWIQQGFMGYWADPTTGEPVSPAVPFWKQGRVYPGLDYHPYHPHYYPDIVAGR